MFQAHYHTYFFNCPNRLNKKFNKTATQLEQKFVSLLPTAEEIVLFQFCSASVMFQFSFTCADKEVNNSSSLHLAAT